MIVSPWTVTVEPRDREKVEDALLAQAGLEGFGCELGSYENVVALAAYAEEHVNVVERLRDDGLLTLPEGRMVRLLDWLMDVDAVGARGGGAESVLKMRLLLEHAQVGVRLADQLEDQLVASVTGDQDDEDEEEVLPRAA